MSGYLLGLATIPAVVLATALAWLLLRYSILTLGFTSLIAQRGGSNRGRNGAAAVLCGAKRAWALGNRDTVVIVARGMDHEAKRAAYDLLNADGPHRDARLSDLPFHRATGNDEDEATS